MSARGAAAAEWAERARPLDLRDRAQAFDRRIVQAVPAYEAEVDRILGGLGSRLRARRAERLADLAAEDPAAASVVDRPLRRMAAAITATLAAAGGFALYFSRADLDPGAAGVLAIAFLGLAAIASAAALLPLRRSDPPASGSVFHAWAAALLGTGTAVGATLGSSGGPGTAALWALAAVLLGLAVTAQLVLSTEPTATRSARAGRVEAYRAALRADTAAAIAEGADAVGAAYGRLDAAEREHLERARDDAYAVLVRRGLLPAAEPRHVPGLLLFDRTAATLAASIGVRDSEARAAFPRA